MRVVIPQIAWHVRDPVLTLDFDPKGRTEQGYYRLVTGGADKLLLIWHLTNPDTIKPEIICVSELTRHQKGINVCRFSPCGNYIAAGDDDSYVFIWKNESISDREEEWNVEKIFRRHVEDVSDLCWSPDSNYLVSGSVDNTSVLWDVKKGTPLQFWSEREHTGFVQGVAYDPLGEFSATMCIDRHLRFFNNKTGKVLHKALKYPPAWLGATDDDETKEKENRPEPTLEKLEAAKPQPPCEPMLTDLEPCQPSEDKPLSEINGEEQEVKAPPKKPVTTLNRLFHDDMLKTFCRRLSFSARGEFLIVPGGLLPPVEKKREESRQGTPVIGEEDENSKDKAPKKFDHEQNNAAIIFCRNSWTNPCAIIPTGTSYSIAARFSTVTYERERKPYEYDPELVNSTKKCDRIMSCVGKLRPPRNDKGILLDLPYRLVYAVATNDSILIGDTASTEPLACIKNIHCTRMTDISWSPDGLVLVASSTDGYCSIITFEKNELGEEFKFTAGEFPTLTPNCFPIAPPEPKPIKKKEPKEPKEVKDNEIKEKSEKEQNEKKDKEPGTPTDNKEEKKKKPLTILKMLSSMKSSPTSSPSGTATSSPSQRPQHDVKLPTESQLPQINSSPKPSPSVSNAAQTGVPTPTTPKPTFLDGWVKKTPVSSIERKQPRRVQLVSLTSSPNTSETEQSQVKVQPRRVQLVTLPSSSNTSETGKSQVKVQTPSLGISANLTESKPVSTNASVAATASSPKPIQETGIKKPRRIQLVTLDEDDKNHPPAKRIATEVGVNGVQTLNENLSVAPAAKKPRRVQLITLDGDKDMSQAEQISTENAGNGSQTENPPNTASEQRSKIVSPIHTPSGPAL